VKVFSYVVDHDNGFAPNPYFNLCTLCRCKFNETGEKTLGQKGRKNVVELAKVGDWIIGTGGESERSAGHGKLIYAMQVDEKVTRGEYFSQRRFAPKKPDVNGEYKRRMGDNLCPKDDYQRNNQFALVSSNYYYFGRNAVDIREFRLERNPRGFHYVNGEDFRPFLEWLTSSFRQGIHGDPHGMSLDEHERNKKCKSSC